MQSRGREEFHVFKGNVVYYHRYFIIKFLNGIQKAISLLIFFLKEILLRSSLNL